MQVNNGYEPGSAAKSAKNMVVFSEAVKKIMKKARKLEKRYEVEMEKAAKIKDTFKDGVIVTKKPLLKAARIKKSYMALAKKYPKLIG